MKYTLDNILTIPLQNEDNSIPTYESSMVLLMDYQRTLLESISDFESITRARDYTMKELGIEATKVALTKSFVHPSNLKRKIKDPNVRKIRTESGVIINDTNVNDYICETKNLVAYQLDTKKVEVDGLFGEDFVYEYKNDVTDVMKYIDMQYEGIVSSIYNVIKNIIDWIRKVLKSIYNKLISFLKKAKQKKK